jgi:hypothetical protein
MCKENRQIEAMTLKLRSRSYMQIPAHLWLDSATVLKCTSICCLDCFLVHQTGYSIIAYRNQVLLQPPIVFYSVTNSIRLVGVYRMK